MDLKWNHLMWNFLWTNIRFDIQYFKPRIYHAPLSPMIHISLYTTFLFLIHAEKCTSAMPNIWRFYDNLTTTWGNKEIWLTFFNKLMVLTNCLLRVKSRIYVAVNGYIFFIWFWLEAKNADISSTGPLGTQYMLVTIENVFLWKDKYIEKRCSIPCLLMPELISSSWHQQLSTYHRICINTKSSNRATPIYITRQLGSFNVFRCNRIQMTPEREDTQPSISNRIFVVHPSSKYMPAQIGLRQHASSDT